MKEYFNKISNTELILLFILLYLLTHIPYIIFWDIRFESDRAITGLMSIHFIKGEFSTYYWGQNYMGTIEMFLTSLFFRLFGISPVILNIVPLLFFLSFFILNFKLLNLIFERAVAMISSFLLIFSSPYLVDFTLRSQPNYSETLFFGTLIFLLFYKKEKENKNNFILFILGFICGVALWTSQLVIYYFICLLIYSVINILRIKVKFQEIFKILFLFIAGFIIGYLPAVIYGFKNGFLHILRFYSGSNLDIICNLKLFFESFFYAFIKMPEHNRVAFLTMIIFVLTIAGVAELIIKLRNSLLMKEKNFSLCFILLLFVVPVVFIFNSEISSFANARYLIPLYPVLIAGISFAILRVSKYSKIFSAFLFIIFVFYNSFAYINLLFCKEHRRKETLMAVIKYLNENSIRGGYADYWFNYTIPFLTEEKIILSPHNLLDRYPPYTEYVKKLDRIAYIDSYNRKDVKDIFSFISRAEYRIIKSTITGSNFPEHPDFQLKKITLLERKY